ncbi:MAG: carbohydrate-binding protein [Gammaproteobacteria bacterium]|nr:MAG: carbohydrate-binding protein [Gammaproteobacteria bacterium]
MSTKLNFPRFSAAIVRATILNQKALRKMATVFALCAPLVGAVQAQAAVSTYTIPFTLQAEEYSDSKGVGNETSTDSGGGLYTAYINTGDWMDYRNHKVIIPYTGRYVISYRVSSPHDGTSFSFNNLNPSGTITRINLINVPNTHGAQRWTTVQTTVTLKAGPHHFNVKAVSGVFTLNWIKIVAANQAGTSSSSSSKVSSSKSSVASSRAISSVAKSSVVSSSKAASSVPAVVSSRAASSLPKSSAKAVSSLAISSKMSSSVKSSLASSSKVSSSSSSAKSSSVASSSLSSSSAPASGYTAVSGPVGLTWIAPKLREDKSALDITELGGYRLRYKAAEDSKYTYIVINDPWATTYNFSWLEGVYIFEIAAFDDAGLLSDFSSFTE